MGCYRNHISISFVQLQINYCVIVDSHKVKMILCVDSCDKFIFSKLWVKWQNLRKKKHCCISVQYYFYELLKPATLSQHSEDWTKKFA